jgi:hypothetical protein
VLNPRQLSRRGVIISLLVLTIVLTACGQPDAPSTICSAETLRAAANLTPQDVVVDASKPVTLSWTYSDPACVPDHYEITLGTSTEGAMPGSVQTSSSTAFNWPGSLTQGTTYYWTVYPVAFNNGQRVRGPGQLAYFYTGPVCAADAGLAAPVPIFPPEGASLDPSAAITLRWDDPSNCTPEGNYYVEIAKSPDFASVVLANQNGHLTELWLSVSWAQEATQDCTKYYWRVQAQSSGKAIGPWSATSSFLVNKIGSACTLIEASSPTPTLAVPPSPVPPTATETSFPQAVFLQANKNTNCRSGPGPEYPILDTLYYNMSQVARGRNEDSTWWYINSPNIAPGYFCWVWEQTVTLSGGDPSQLPIIPPPPEPTVTPEPTSTPGG